MTYKGYHRCRSSLGRQLVRYIQCHHIGHTISPLLAQDWRERAIRLDDIRTFVCVAPEAVVVVVTAGLVVEVAPAEVVPAEVVAAPEGWNRPTQIPCFLTVIEICPLTEFVTALVQSSVTVYVAPWRVLSFTKMSEKGTVSVWSLVPEFRTMTIRSTLSGLVCCHNWILLRTYVLVAIFQFPWLRSRMFLLVRIARVAADCLVTSWPMIKEDLIAAHMVKWSFCSSELGG